MSEWKLVPTKLIQEAYDAMREPTGEWHDIKCNTVLPKIHTILAAAPQPPADSVPDNDKVICPQCCWQFKAIPVNVQKQLFEREQPPAEIVLPPMRTLLVTEDTRVIDAKEHIILWAKEFARAAVLADRERR